MLEEEEGGNDDSHDNDHDHDGPRHGKRKESDESSSDSSDDDDDDSDDGSEDSEDESARAVMKAVATAANMGEQPEDNEEWDDAKYVLFIYKSLFLPPSLTLTHTHWPSSFSLFFLCGIDPIGCLLLMVLSQLNFRRPSKLTSFPYHFIVVIVADCCIFISLSRSRDLRLTHPELP